MPQQPTTAATSVAKTTSGKNASSSARFSSCTPENPSNPFDSVGIHHNLGLDYVFAQNSHPTIEQVVSLSNAYTMKVYGGREPSLSASLPTEESIRTLLRDATDRFSSMIDHTNYSANCKAQLKQLIALVTDTTSANCSEYCHIKANIVAFETDVLNSTSISQTEKNQILYVSSVARYSAFRWSEKFHEQNPSTANNRKWWEVALVIVSDVAGGIGGSSVGVTVGGALGASGGMAGILLYLFPDPDKP